MHAHDSSVNFSSNVNPSPRKNSCDAERSLTGRLTKMRRDMRWLPVVVVMPCRPGVPGKLIAVLAALLLPAAAQGAVCEYHKPPPRLSVKEQVLRDHISLRKQFGLPSGR